eukprot:4083130-Alexandrium_andersonii.AAC.1
MPCARFVASPTQRKARITEGRCAFQAPSARSRPASTTRPRPATQAIQPAIQPAIQEVRILRLFEHT